MQTYGSEEENPGSIAEVGFSWLILLLFFQWSSREFNTNATNAFKQF